MMEPQDSLHFLDYWRVMRTRKEVIIAVSLLVVVTGALVTSTMPKVYTSSAVIQVKEESPDLEVFRADVFRYDPLYLRTQFEIIQSRPVVEEVIRKRDLTEKLGKAYGYLESLDPEQSFEQTVKIVSDNMTVQNFRDTNLIEIQVKLAEPKDIVRQEVAAIVNEIATVYRDQNMRRSRSVMERALAALDESLIEQARKVGDAEANVEKIRQEYEIDVIGGVGPAGSYGTYGSYGTLDKQSLAQLEGMRIRARTDLARKETRFRTISSLSPEDLLDAVPYVVQDQGLALMVAERGAREVDLKHLLETLGPKHPEVMQLTARIAEQKRKILDALDGLKTGIRVDYEAEKDAYAIILKELEELKTRERSAEASRYREFETAQAELDQLRRINDGLEVRRIQERIELHIPRTTVETMAPGKPPEEGDYVTPRPLLNLILSILLGVGAGVGLAFFIEYLDTSVKTIEDIERDMGEPVLGVIPQKVVPFIEEVAEAAHREPYRVLRTNIQFSNKLAGGKTLCVTSGSVGEGKTLTVFNLAYVCAELGQRVLIVDSDLHRPRQHKILGVSNARGLSNVLHGDAQIKDVIVKTAVANLDIIPSGKVSPGVRGLLDSVRLTEVVNVLREAYDYVLFDAPPIIGVSDASCLVRQMDGVLLVVQHRKYPKTVAMRAKDVIDNLGANLIGVVLNNINISRDYTYYYHYSYYYQSRRDDEKAKT